MKQASAASIALGNTDPEPTAATPVVDLIAGYPEAPNTAREVSSNDDGGGSVCESTLNELD